jgi:peptidoglycan/LPS O-acetylase OafA/YrhL
MWSNTYAMDIVTAGATAAFIAYCTKLLNGREAGLPFPMNILESKTSAALARVSYSLILVHFPLLWLIHYYITKPMDASVTGKLLALLALGVPISMLAAWLFYAVFERRFMVRAQSPLLLGEGRHEAKRSAG